MIFASQKLALEPSKLCMARGWGRLCVSLVQKSLGDTFSQFLRLHYRALTSTGAIKMAHQQKWGASGRKCLSGHPSGSGCKSCSPGLKKLHAHHTASAAGLTMQEGRMSFAWWHLPWSTDTHRESTQLGLLPQAATLCLASLSPHDSGSSEMLVISSMWILTIWKKTMKPPCFKFSSGAWLWRPPKKKQLSPICQRETPWERGQKAGVLGLTWAGAWQGDGEQLWRKSGSSPLAPGWQTGARCRHNLWDKNVMLGKLLLSRRELKPFNNS